MALAIGGRCHYHPSRAGIGICVECRNVVCSDCSTQFQGINRCAACLTRMHQKAAAPAKKHDFGFTSLLTTALVFGLLFGGALALAAAVAP